jgi:hypothetical protein
VVVLVVLVCVAAAALIAWLLVEFAGGAFGALSMPRVSELLGFAATPGPRITRHQTGPPPAPAPAMSRSPVVSPVVAPATPAAGPPDAPVSLPPDGAPFVSHVRRHAPLVWRHAPLVSRVRRRQAAVDEPSGPRRDLGMASAARKVGSRAREAILGYPFPAPDTAPTAPYAGEEPVPGETVVLVGDDVEAWVRERLYGGRLPNR